MMNFRFALLAASILSLIAFVSCQENSEDQPGGGGGGGSVPPGMARLYGDVRDASGQSVSDVALHVVYDLAPASPADHVLQGSYTNFYSEDPLFTTCDGTTPLPDGTLIKIFWDVDSDGPDATDPRPPLCDNPPNCEGAPGGTVNQIEFPINAAQYGGTPGTFFTDPVFVVVGTPLVPNIFYLRIYCNDGSVLYTSDAMDLPEGPSEVIPVFHCTPCTGAIPSWHLGQAYPNPTGDSATVDYSLAESAQALLTMRELSSGRVDTLLRQSVSAGDYSLPLSLHARANGLYEYRLSAGSFSESHSLLKNETGVETLRVTPGINMTPSDGTYRFDTAAGVSIDRRGNNNENLGTGVLDRVHLFAIKSGYQVVDTLLTVTSAESLRVDLTLPPL